MFSSSQLNPTSFSATNTAIPTSNNETNGQVQNGIGTASIQKNNESVSRLNSPELSPAVAAASPHWSVTLQQKAGPLHRGRATLASSSTSSFSSTPSATKRSTQSSFTPLVAFCFTMNYVVGTGFLTIPWAFVQSGILLSAAMMILSSITSDIVKDYLLETMARAEVMLDVNLHWITTSTNKTTNKTTRSDCDRARDKTISTKLLERSSSDAYDDEYNYDQNYQSHHRALSGKLVDKQNHQLIHAITTIEEMDSGHWDNLASCQKLSSTAQTINSNGKDIEINGNALDNQCHDCINNPETKSLLEPKTKLEEKNTIGTKRYNSISDMDHPSSYSKTLGKIINNSKNNKIDTTVSHPSTPSSRRRRLIRQEMEDPGGYLVGDRKFEVNALCRVFLGKHGLYLYTFFLCLYTCGTLCAYTNVFASAMSSALPIFDDHHDYRDYRGSENNNTNNKSSGLLSLLLPPILQDSYLCYVLIFAAIVIPLSCMELNEQISVQVAMTICRFFMLFLMIFTSSNCAKSTSSLASTINDDNIQIVEENNKNHSWIQLFLLRPTGLFQTLPIIVMATMYHHSIPGLAHPVTDKKQLGTTIFRSTIICSSIAYTILGIVVGLSFGSLTTHNGSNGMEQSANLNWKNCNLFGDSVVVDNDENLLQPTSTASFLSWLSPFLSLYIVLFPVLDVLSAFPLNAITLGNNMFGAYFGRSVHEYENNRYLRICFRLLASIPPLVLGACARELGTITAYTGTSGFILGFTIPSLLYLYSKRTAKRKQFYPWTYYTSYGCNDTIATILTWFGIVMFVLVFLTSSLSFMFDTNADA